MKMMGWRRIGTNTRQLSVIWVSSDMKGMPRFMRSARTPYSTLNIFISS